MNTANLQMEGTLLALAALCEALKRKGLLDEADLAAAFTCADKGVAVRGPGMSESNREAIRFPIRFLRLALERDGAALDYAAVAADIGRSKERLHR